MDLPAVTLRVTTIDTYVLCSIVFRHALVIARINQRRPVRAVPVHYTCFKNTMNIAPSNNIAME